MTSSDDSLRPTGRDDAPRPVSPAAGPTGGPSGGPTVGRSDGTAGESVAGVDRRGSGTADPTGDPASTDRPATGRRAADRPISQEPVPELEPVGAGGKTAGMWIGLILGAIILVLLLIFVIQNSDPTPFTYFNANFNLPLGVAMLLAAIAGALVMALVGSVRMFQMSWTIRKLRKQQDKIHRATR